MQERMKSYILGDFNLHIGNAEDQDTQVFKDTLEAVCLVLHVGFTAHWCCNILNLVITEVWAKSTSWDAPQGHSY